MNVNSTPEALSVTVRMAAAQARDRSEGLRCPIARMDVSASAVALSSDPETLASQVGDGVAILAPCAVADHETAAKAVRQHMKTGGTLPFVMPVTGTGLMLVDQTGQRVQQLADLLAGDESAIGSDPVGVGRLTGCIALVTGAAQGFGKGIAAELAHDGAVVAVADVNDTAGEATVAELEATFGAGCACYVRMDVTDPESAATAVKTVMARFGGLDLLVANAGVLKAGGIEEMDAAAFDLVTRVNYTGYFTCVQAVVPWMRLQHQLAPAHFMDIVQINSKSGLEGSKRNFAYAGSKFAALGLTQSFALELIEDNIKVNSICPGNYFDGPLWSDPDRGLFVQYLNAGKVPGAKTIEDVRAFYMEKIPRGRGCTPADVATAIRYVVEQTYETGQAVPVTGGQVMLK